VVFGEHGPEPVGAVDGEVSLETLERFNRAVHSRFRQRSAQSQSHFVHTGAPRPKLKRWAAERGIVLETWIEYQSLLDLTAYVSKLRTEAEQDDLYPPALYMKQRYQTIDRFGKVSRENGEDLA
jgi:NACHT-associated inactive Restriction Endonuclease 2